MIGNHATKKSSHIFVPHLRSSILDVLMMIVGCSSIEVNSECMNMFSKLYISLSH
jgi:hypothetical protein